MNQNQIIDKTIEILNEVGWTQGISKNPKGEMCLGAAVYEAGKDSPVYYLLFDKLLKFCGELSLADWNDQPGRTKEEVFVLLNSVKENVTS